MNNKRTILGMTAALGVMALWFGIRLLVDHLHPEWAEQYQKAHTLASETPTTQPATDATTQQATGPETRPSSTTGPSITAAPPTAHLHVIVPATSPSSAALALGSATPHDPNWSMQLQLMADGAGVQRVTLNEFQKGVKDKSPYTFQEPYERHPGTEPLGTSYIEIDGNRLDLATVPWNLQGQTETSATYVLDLGLPGSEKSDIRLSKSYTLPKKNSPSGGFEVAVDYAIQNQTDHAINVLTGMNGPTVPMREIERGADRQIIAGYREGTASIRVEQHVAEEFRKDKIFQDISESGKKEPVMWAGAGSSYFSALVLPVAAESGATPASYRVTATALEPENEEHNDIATQFSSGTVVIAAGKSASLPLSVFMGPKKRDLLMSAHYAAFPRMYDKTLILGSSYCNFCTFPWLVALLVTMLSFFHGIFRDWGLAIIALVLVVRLLLHPITKKSQVYMVRMGKMGPEMERLKKKYADDKDALNKAMMQFYKEQGMAPILGCLPMFLQMPIWIALWTALQSTFDLRLSPFLQFGRVHLTWISDLARPDALISWKAVTLPIVNVQIDSLNLLPLLLAVVFYMQQKYTPKPVATTPEQAQQQKMMTWMSTLMFPIFLYKGPAGLNLYIFASTLFGIIESKVVRDHIKQREEAEKSGRVIVETRPTRGARRRGGDDDLGTPKKPAGKWAQWLADLQAKAEQIKREGGKGK